jgi:outer membrane protein OmpA-like peptidoglycan-associated protein
MNHFLNLGLFAILATSCAASAPKELLNARSAYDRASNGPAAQLNPTDLHSAKQTLDVAEHSFAEQGNTQETRDLAYTAERRAQTAEARSEGIQADRVKEQTLTAMQAAQATMVTETSAALARAKSELGAQGQELKAQGQALRTERERREEAEKSRADAEKRAAAAMAALAGAATVKQEARGIVITLSGGVLFTTNEATLLPSAQTKLNSVADALTKQDPEARIVVEGHADSQGAAAHNQDLSQRRAEAVRAYLISRGVAADRLTAQGFGVTRPIADNASAEGRANNRRVEIVIQPAQAAGPSNTSTSSR